MKNVSIFIILIISVLIITNTFAQKTEAVIDFYQMEQQSWREYIERFPTGKSQSNFDVTFYYLDVEIGVDSAYIRGSVLCRFNSTEDNVQDITLNLHHSLEIDSLTGNVSYFNFVNDSIYITLDRAYQVGESGQVQIFYQGIPELAGGYKGLRYESHANNEPIIATLSTPFLAHYWWPCKDGPGDKPDSVYIDITIPDTVINDIPLIAVSNGTLENVISLNGKKTFQWRERYPIVPYYVMAAISNFKHFQQNYTGTLEEGFPIDYYVFNEYLTQAQVGVADMPNVMDLFSNLFGSYPFHTEKYGMTQLGFYGGIENQTNTIINNMSLSWFIVSVHELAHSWFGDMITCETWHHGWLNEGFATYCEALWDEHTSGFAAYQTNMSYNQYYEGGTLYLQDDSDPFNIFIGIIYAKGAYLLHMLRGVLGDSIFFNCLYEYATDPNLMYDHATTENFQDICETISARELDFFFDQWVYDEYYPKYEYSFFQNDSTFETTVTIYQTQENNGWRSIFEMPIQLKFEFLNGGDSLITVWNDQQVQAFQFNLSRQVSNFLFDPNEWILKEAISITTPHIIVTDNKVDDFRGNNNGHADPGETIDLVVQLGNFGITVDSVRAVLSTEDPMISIIADSAYYGDINSGAITDNIASPFTLQISSATLAHTAYFSLQIIGGQQYREQLNFSLEVGTSKILLVDDDNEENYELYFFSMAEKAYIKYDPWQISSQGIPADSLFDYEMVIWFTGNDRESSLTEEEQSLLGNYLDAGGRLCISGQNIGYDLVADGTASDSLFFNNYLHAQFVADGSEKIRVLGISGDPISSGLSPTFTGDYGGAGNQNSPSNITPLEPAVTIFKYLPGIEPAALRYENPETGSRIVYFAFGLEGIAGPKAETAAILLGKTLTWLASVSTSVEEKSKPVTFPMDYYLSQNYPNPFNPITTIKYSLPTKSKVVLKIYNILGEEVRILVNKTQSSGFKSIVWNGRNNSGFLVNSGIYLYSLQVGNFIQTRKMVFLK